MPERFEIYIVYKRRYIDTLPFLSFYLKRLESKNVTAVWQSSPLWCSFSTST